ncbi:hypothetical protein ACFCZ1_05375 [Streptomyces sp. NPDC056224]|uniref:hypothetical protein n=1 Tax=Streptomyces sp. NPDC056224 TaxID=3345750 RepID=UPI0035E093BE
MRLRTFLARFRLMGTPGAAVAAVPADRTGDPAAELAPVLGRLTGVLDEASEIRARAEDEAAALVRRAARQAADIVADAEGRAGRVRAGAAAAALAEARREEIALLAVGRSTAEQVRRRSVERIPGLADRVAGYALGRPDGVGSDEWAPGGSPV